MSSVTNNNSQTGPDPQTARREYVVMKWTVVLALAVGCASPLALNLVDPDLWGHVRYAQDWLADGELPTTATHTFTAADHPWINHENLAELALAQGHKYLGTTGLLVAKCAWGMTILFAMVWIAGRHGVHPLASWALMLLVASNLQPFFPLRPQLLSFGLCSIMLVLLDRGFSRWQEERTVRWSFLVGLPVVFAVWINSHGAVVAGLCILGAYLGGRMIELALERPQNWLPKSAGFAAFGIGSVAATLANPYGLQLHRWLAMSLGQPRPEITEWAPPSPDDPTFWPWLALLAVAGFSLSGTRKRRDWVQIAILALVAWQSASHLRHIAFVAVLCGFWIPEHFQSALGRLRPKSSESLSVMRLSPGLRRMALGVLAVSIALQTYVLGKRLTDLPVDRSFYPVDAIQFMADNQLEGKLVVTFNWAQYAIAALAPDVKVAFDGRFRTCYPQEIVDMHFDFLAGENDGKRSRSPSSGEIDPSRVLKYRSPDLVLVDRSYEQPVDVMRAEAERDHPEWSLLYRDPVAELWGRASRYDAPDSPHYFPIAARTIDAPAVEGGVAWPALPSRQPEDQLANHSHAIVENSQP